jgi:uncharacterized membrane protein
MFLSKAMFSAFFVSMLPVIELRGGIPFGVGLGLTVWQAFFAALAGNIIIGIVIIALLKPVLELLMKTKFFRNMASNISAKFERKATKMNTKPKTASKFFGIIAFVGVPLPLTGVWTGAALAVFLGLPFWAAAAACSIGVVISGTIILSITLLLPEYTAVIFNVFLACAVVLTVVFFIYVLRKPKKDRNNLS